MADNTDAQNDDENRESSAPLPPMVLAEIQTALNDDTHPRHEEARCHAADAAKNLVPSLKKLADSVASQVNAGDIMSQFRGQHDASLARELMDPTPYELPRRPVVDIPELDNTKLMDGMEAALQAKAERERRQDATAEASLETMQAIAAQMLQLNEQMVEVDNLLESGNTSATIWNRWILVIAALTLIATVIGIFT